MKASPHILVVARDITHILRTLADLAATLSIGTLVAFALGFLIIDRTISASLSPIGKLTIHLSKGRIRFPLFLPRA